MPGGRGFSTRAAGGGSATVGLPSEASGTASDGVSGATVATDFREGRRIRLPSGVGAVFSRRSVGVLPGPATVSLAASVPGVAAVPAEWALRSGVRGSGFWAAGSGGPEPGCFAVGICGAGPAPGARPSAAEPATGVGLLGALALSVAVGDGDGRCSMAPYGSQGLSHATNTARLRTRTALSTYGQRVLPARLPDAVLAGANTSGTSPRWRSSSDILRASRMYDTAIRPPGPAPGVARLRRWLS